MLPNANGAASARPIPRQLRPVVSTIFAGMLLIATSAATPSMAQHHGHHGHQGHVAPKAQPTKAKKPSVKRRSDTTVPNATAQRHSRVHAGSGARGGGAAAAPATREFATAHERMMQNMALPYTGDPDVDFRVQMIPHHQGAIDMARVALRHAKDPWTRQLAETVIVEQQREIAEMQAWLARRGAMVPSGGQPTTHTIGANSFRSTPEEPGTLGELRGQSWAPGSGVPAQR